MQRVSLVAQVVSKKWHARDGWAYNFNAPEFRFTDVEYQLQGALDGKTVHVWVISPSAAADTFANCGWDADQLRADRKVRSDFGCAWMRFEPEDKDLNVVLVPGTANEQQLYSVLDMVLTSRSLAAWFSFEIGFSVQEDNPHSRSPTTAAFLCGKPAFAYEPFDFAAVRQGNLN